MIRRILRDEKGGTRRWPEDGPGDRNKRPRRRPTRHNYFGDPPGKAFDQDGNELEIKYSRKRDKMRCTAWLKARGGEHGRRPREHACQCSKWSEPHRDKCRWHGGRMLEYREERGLVATGVTSKYAVKVAARAKELRQDPELATMRRELSYLKAVFERAVGKLETGAADAPHGSEVVGLVEAIRRGVETQTRVEGERKAKLNVSELVVVVNQIRLIIEEEVENLDVRRRIATRLRGLVLRPARAGDRQERDAADRVG
jgi:hypothetical protein